jgi:hypothetical protein
MVLLSPKPQHIEGVGGVISDCHPSEGASVKKEEDINDDRWLRLIVFDAPLTG